MRRRKKKFSHVGHERWLVSYADFITLLFAFFVVLYASEQVDKKKAGQLAAAIQAAFQQMGVFQGSPLPPGGYPNEPAPVPQAALNKAVKNAALEKLQSELQTALAQQIERKEIAMRIDGDGLVISLREAGFFESGSAQMKSTSTDTLDRIGSMLQQHDYDVRVEGYTDNVPIHNSQFPSNWELSTSRSSEIVRLLIVRDGFPPDRLSAAGFGEYHPVTNNSTTEGRSQNRRVDIVVLGSPQISAPVAKAPPNDNIPALPPSDKNTGKPQPSPVVPAKP